MLNRNFALEVVGKPKNKYKHEFEGRSYYVGNEVRRRSASCAGDEVIQPIDSFDRAISEHSSILVRFAHELGVPVSLPQTVRRRILARCSAQRQKVSFLTASSVAFGSPARPEPNWNPGGLADRAR